MKTKVKVTYEFTVLHDTQEELDKAKKELEREPVHQMTSSAGYSIKIIPKSGVAEK